jgi:hypothetical protein
VISFILLTTSSVFSCIASMNHFLSSSLQQAQFKGNYEKRGQLKRTRAINPNIETNYGIDV